METVYRVIYTVSGSVTSEVFTNKRSASNAARKFSREPYGTVARIYKCTGDSRVHGFFEHESVYVTTYKNGKRSASY